MKSPTTGSDKPTVALVVGDPAGIGPELAAKLLADPAMTNVANLLVIGDARVLERGAEIARVSLDIPIVAAREEIEPGITVLFDVGEPDPNAIEVGVASRESGQSSLENFRVGLELAQEGSVSALCFTPFNKAAMRMACPAYEDEIGFVAAALKTTAQAREFNILGGLWNARVTSHIPISAVSGQIKRDAVLTSIRHTHDHLREAGVDRPRIAVAGLNPHAGDGGNFGFEDEKEISPAVADAQSLNILAEGPFSPDTVFVRAIKESFDAVLTMYHDQGQIAMKLLGFKSAVTLLGGFPFPICTPAHGSAYDIAGKGIADLGASREALLLAAKMALRNRPLPCPVPPLAP